MRRFAVLLALPAAAACTRGPEQTFQVQGTVLAIGTARPVPGATVHVEWPRPMGDGEIRLSTDPEGRYAVKKTYRGERNCTGLTVTVRARGYASAYSLRDSTGAECGDSVLTIDFRLFPIP